MSFQDYVDATLANFPELRIELYYTPRISAPGRDNVYAVGMYDYCTQIITICSERKEEEMIHTLLHEVGHHVYRYPNRDWSSKWGVLSKVVVPEYSLKTYSEKYTHAYQNDEHEEEAWAQGFANLFKGNLSWYKDVSIIQPTKAILQGKAHAIKSELTAHYDCMSTIQCMVVGLCIGLSITASWYTLLRYGNWDDYTPQTTQSAPMQRE